MKYRAIVDIAIVAAVFWGAWLLQFAGLEHAGFWAVTASMMAGALLMRVRKEPWSDIGLRQGGDARFVFTRAGEFTILVLATGALVVGIATALGHPPTTSSVLTQLPDSLPSFLLDVVFGVWLGAAIGEEFVFRGFLLNRFTMLFGSNRSGIGLAVLAQAAWFGSAHISQGIGGMVMAGAIGAVVGVFFLTRARRSLLPLIIGHGLVDTVSQTIYYINH